jgi:hypothetical protein
MTSSDEVGAYVEKPVPETMSRMVIHIANRKDYRNFFVLPYSLKDQIPHMIDVMTKHFNVNAEDIDIDFRIEEVTARA